MALPCRRAVLVMMMLGGAALALHGPAGAAASDPAQGAATAGAQPQQAARLTVGQPAPTFALPSSQGASYDVAARTGEGPLVMIFFRGTW